jgi:hypothetical protein
MGYTENEAQFHLGGHWLPFLSEFGLVLDKEVKKQGGGVYRSQNVVMRVNPTVGVLTEWFRKSLGGLMRREKRDNCRKRPKK